MLARVVQSGEVAKNDEVELPQSPRNGLCPFRRDG